jgi:hypothetical protein
VYLYFLKNIIVIGSVPKYCGFLSKQCWRGFAIRVKQIKSRIKNPRQLKDPESVIKCIPTIFWNRTLSFKNYKTSQPNKAFKL